MDKDERDKDDKDEHDRPEKRDKGDKPVSPEFARAENEDDDGYDPWSDRRPIPEPLFERDPWA